MRQVARMGNAYADLLPHCGLRVVGDRLEALLFDWFENFEEMQEIILRRWSVVLRDRVKRWGNSYADLLADCGVGIVVRML